MDVPKGPFCAAMAKTPAAADSGATFQLGKPKRPGWGIKALIF